MKNILKFCLIALLLLSSSHLFAKSAKITIKLAKGDVYTTVMTMNSTMNQQMMGQTLNMKQDMVFTQLMTVKEVMDNGNYQISQTYTKIKMAMLVNDQNMDFDSENEDNNPQLASLGKLKDVVIKFELSPNGEVSNVSGLDELMQSIGDNPQTAQMMKGITNNDALSSTFSYIPQRKVKKGDSYIVSTKMAAFMDMEIETNYTVESIDKPEITLNASSDIQFSPDEPIKQNGIEMALQGKGKQNGSFVINLADGMVKSSKTKQIIDMEMTFKNPQDNKDMTIPMSVNSTILMKITKN